MPPSVKVKLTVLTKHKAAIEACAEYLKKLAYASDVEIIEDKERIPEKQRFCGLCRWRGVYASLRSSLTLQKEIERLKKEAEKNSKEIGRAEGN